MSIDHQSRLAEDMAEQHVGGFAANAGQSQQLLHPARDVTAETFQDCACRRLQRLGLLPEKTGRLDELLNFFKRGEGHCRNLWKSPEQLRRRAINSLVGALGGQNSGDQTLPWGGEIQADARLRIKLRQCGRKPSRPRGPGSLRLAQLSQP